MPTLRPFYLAFLVMGAIPAAQSQQSTPPSPWQRPDNSKALFESLGIHLNEIKDREGESDPHFELYLRVLSRLQQLPLGVIHEWSKSPPEQKMLLDSPQNYRGELFRLGGVVSSKRTITVPKDLAERFDVKTLYRLSVAVNERSGGEGSSVGFMDVWTTDIPSGLRVPEGESAPDGIGTGAPLPHAKVHVKFDAVFLAVTKEQDRESAGEGFERPVFVTSKLAWLPRNLQEGENLSPSILTLSKAGFDVGLLDPVRAETSKRLTPQITEPFLQMLAAQRKVDRSSLKAQPLELAQLVSHPESFIGEAIEFDAIARRVVEIPIEKEEDRKRLGIDRYYEIDLVLPKSVRTLVKDKDGVNREVVQENFPMTVCTTSPPQGLSLGDDLRQEIHASAFFFKLWAYESQFAQAHAPDAMQVSPLFLTNRVESTAPPEISYASAIWVVGGAMAILACLAVWGYLVLRTDDLRELANRKESIAPPILPPPAANP